MNSKNKDEIRQMTFDEIFESRIEYFICNRNSFNKQNQVFLDSILSQYKTIGVSKKQMQLFVCNVNSILRQDFFPNKIIDKTFGKSK